MGRILITMKDKDLSPLQVGDVLLIENLGNLQILKEYDNAVVLKDSKGYEVTLPKEIFGKVVFVFAMYRQREEPILTFVDGFKDLHLIGKNIHNPHQTDFPQFYDIEDCKEFAVKRKSIYSQLNKVFE